MHTDIRHARHHANALLQVHVLRGTPIFYFFTTGFSHFLDFLMQGLWNETQTSPLEARYWSCVPYLLGEGQAMMYSVRPKSRKHSWIPGLPFWTSPIYLRQTMAKTLARQDVEFDFMVQVQTDPHRMPIENAGVRWPEKLSPFVPVATLRILHQEFDTPERSSPSRAISPTRPGTASPSTVRSATRAARAGACIGSCATYGRP